MQVAIEKVSKQRAISVQISLGDSIAGSSLPYSQSPWSLVPTALPISHWFLQTLSLSLPLQHGCEGGGIKNPLETQKETGG